MDSDIYTVDSDKDLVDQLRCKLAKLNAKVYRNVLLVQDWTLTYENTGQNPMVLTIQVKRKRDEVLSSLTAMIDNEIIQTKVMEKGGVADEKMEDEVAKGK